VDALLKLAADAGVEVSAAESALEEGAPAAARDALDRADDALAALRDRWPQMSAAERRLIGAAAAEVRARRDAAAARISPARPLSEGLAELDPEQEQEPGGTPGP
jgi:hypothetical protein